MSISLVVAVAGTIAAAVGTGLLARRCARTPRIDLVALVCAAAVITISVAAQAYGYAKGFSPTTFRVIEGGALVIAPLGLLWGIAELSGKSLGARVAARLPLAAVAVVAGVILATDQLGSVSFSTAWPSVSGHGNPISTAVTAFAAALTVVWVLATVAVNAVRAGRDPGWRPALLATGLAGAGAVLLQALQVALPVASAYPAICAIAAVLAWNAGERAAGLRLEALHGDAEGVWADPARPARYAENTFDDLYRDTGYGPDARRGGYADDSGYGSAAGDSGYGPALGDSGYGPAVGDSGYGLYRADTDFGRNGYDTGFGMGGPETGFDPEGPHTGFELGGPDTGFGRAGEDTDYGLFRPPVAGDGLASANGRPGPGEDAPGAVNGHPAAGPGREESQTALLYGQITIYTLIDDRTDDFDRMMRQVVDKVKAEEPGTLVFVVHGVPSAPMQRILYEVYRDRDAFNEHVRQPYFRDFEEERGPCVLATNVIELGVRLAKVSPLSGERAAAPSFGVPPVPVAPLPPGPPLEDTGGWSRGGARHRPGSARDRGRP